MKTIRPTKKVAVAAGALAALAAAGTAALAATGVVAVPGLTDMREAPATARLVSMEEAPGNRALLLSGGTTDLAGLAELAAGIRRRDAVTAVRDGVWRIELPVVVERGARLEVHDATVDLRSDDGGAAGLVARGGEIDIRLATVRSRTGDDGPDTDVSDGRAWLAAEEGGTLEIAGADVEHLGYDRPGRRGVEWRGGATTGSARNVTVVGGYTGLVVDGATGVEVWTSRVEHSLTAGILTHGATDLLVDGTTLRSNATDGMTVGGESSQVALERVIASGNGQHGVQLADSSTGTSITSSTIYDNAQAGLAVVNAYTVSFEESKVWGNETGVALVSSSDEVTIRRNRITANSKAGVSLLSAGSVAALSENELDHNGAGVMIADGNAVVGPDNRIYQNGTGISLLDHSPGVTITGNAIEANTGDGVLMLASSGVDMHGNTFADNQFAAFSVLANGESARFKGTNDVGPGRRYGWERVLQDYEVRLATDQPPAPPAHAVPVPEEWFSAIPKQRRAGGRELNPLFTPNNLTPEQIASMQEDFQ